jgi:hypothetical protein
MSADWMAGADEILGCLGCSLLIGGGIIGAFIAGLIVYFTTR